MTGRTWGPRPVLAGRYELLDRIGQGGMAEVFRARLEGPGGFEKIVVIKRLLSSQAEDANAVKMFVEEAKLTAAASHDNIAQVLELGQSEDGRYFIVLEHVAGSDLAQLVRAATTRNLRVPVWLTLHVYAEVLEALSFLHELRDARGRRLEVVHRDVTPSNVLLSTLGKVKLSDFGVAQFVGKTSTTQAGQLKGKLGYMSPEQLESRPLDGRADLFAVGVGLWECLAQRPLFEGTDPEVMLAICEGRRPRLSELVTDVPADLVDVVHQALAIDRAERFQSASELQAALLDVLQRIRPALRRAELSRTMAQLLATPPQGIEDSDTSAAGPPSAAPAARPAPVADVRAHTAVEGDTDATRPRGDALGRRPAPALEDSLTTSAARVSLFVRASKVGPVEELEYGPALDRLRDHALDGGGAAISADGKRWLDAAELSRLVGLDYVASTAEAPSNVTVVASLDECSIVAALAILARERHTGTLAIARTKPMSGEWYELDLADGRPTRVSTNVVTMQLPALLVRERLVAAEHLPALVATAIRERRPLEALVEEHQAKPLDRAALSLARLAALFTWAGADYTFSIDYKARRHAPLARTLLGAALRVAERTLSVEQLLERLGPRARQRLHPTDTWGPGLAELELDPRQLATAERLRGGRTAAELLDVDALGAKGVLALAWVLAEAELLRAGTEAQARR